MATSVLCRRTAALCRTFQGLSCSQTILSVNSHVGLLSQTASYNPRPLWLNLREPYIPDKDSEKTPEWQKTARYDRKLYGRYGSASGVEPASLWPIPEQLERIAAEEAEWNPPLEVMLKNIAVREKKETEARRAKEKVIEDNMAKMPKMIADWRRGKREAKAKQKEEKIRRTKLLAEARERFGFAVDPRSPKFLDMVAEIEKEERKKKKLIKRQQKEDQLSGIVTPADAPS